MKYKFIFTGIFLLASFFRLYGVNWDQNQHLHPDERFLTMVTAALTWPKDINEFLDASASPLNPHNKNFGFFVYGTFPIFFTKWMAEGMGKGDYTNLTIVGRQLSAFMDLGTVILVFLIGKTIADSSNNASSRIKYQVLSITGKKVNNLNTKYVIRNTIPLLSMFLYSVMVLPIQLSHFYAVDTYLVFFITLSFYLCCKLVNPQPSGSKVITPGLLGIAFGLALASKITAGLFLPIIFIFFISGASKSGKIFNVFYVFFIFNILFFIFTYITFRFAQPYFFANPNIFDITPNAKILENWRQLKSFDDRTGGFPPAVQWITTRPYLFPMKNLILWGLGLPLGIIFLLSIPHYVLRVISEMRNGKFTVISDPKCVMLNLSLLWILFLFGYQGGQFIKALRYFYPVYPFIAVISGYFLNTVIKKLKIGLSGYWAVGLLTLIYPLAFVSIYSRPHSRVEASYWIYKNIPSGSTLSSEEWDDGLPLSVDNNIHERYKSVQLPLYWPDTEEKWRMVNDKLRQTDYIIESSNRLYGSIMTFPQKYPVSRKFYSALFDGSLGFEKVAEFTSRPNIPFPDFLGACLTPPFARYGIAALKSQECPLPGISLVDDYADETFTVYDHPKVTIFKKVRPVDYLNFLYKS